MDLDAKFQLVQTLMDQGRYAIAAKEMKELLHNDPQSINTLYLLAQLQAAQGQNEAALLTLGRALAQAPNDQTLLCLELWLSYRFEEPNEILRKARNLKKYFPDDPYAFDIEAVTLYFKLRRPAEEARAILSQALRLHPGYLPALKTLFYIALNERDEALAKSILEDHLKLDFGSEDCCVMIAGYIKKHNILSADRIREFIVRFPGNERLIHAFESADRRARPLIDVLELIKRVGAVDSQTERLLMHEFVSIRFELGIADRRIIEEIVCAHGVLSMAIFLLWPYTTDFQPSREFWSKFWKSLRTDQICFSLMQWPRYSQFEVKPPLSADDLAMLIAMPACIEAIRDAYASDPVEGFSILLDQADSEEAYKDPWISWDRLHRIGELAHSPIAWNHRNLERFINLLTRGNERAGFLEWLETLNPSDFLSSPCWRDHENRILDLLLEQAMDTKSILDKARLPLYLKFFFELAAVHHLKKRRLKLEQLLKLDDLPEHIRLKLQQATRPEAMPRKSTP